MIREKTLKEYRDSWEQQNRELRRQRDEAKALLALHQVRDYLIKERTGTGNHTNYRYTDETILHIRERAVGEILAHRPGLAPLVAKLAQDRIFTFGEFVDSLRIKVQTGGRLLGIFMQMEVEKVDATWLEELFSSLDLMRKDLTVAEATTSSNA